MTATETRQGIGVSPGSAYGPVVQVAPPVRPPADEAPTEDREAALADVKAAFESVAVAWSWEQIEEEFGIVLVEGTQAFRDDAHPPFRRVDP